MAQRASELGYQTTFCGIYGSGKLPEAKKSFLSNGMSLSF